MQGRGVGLPQGGPGLDESAPAPHRSAQLLASLCEQGARDLRWVVGRDLPRRAGVRALDHLHGEEREDALQDRTPAQRRCVDAAAEGGPEARAQAPHRWPERQPPFAPDVARPAASTTTGAGRLECVCRRAGGSSSNGRGGRRPAKCGGTGSDGAGAAGAGAGSNLVDAGREQRAGSGRTASSRCGSSSPGRGDGSGGAKRFVARYRRGRRLGRGHAGCSGVSAAFGSRRSCNEGGIGKEGTARTGGGAGSGDDTIACCW
mmetsp:Transcript_27319/g.79199  ORF Transcript_27319/g.79199 Transcript_27319/m.79199 type:complete len:260 (+) Transcript_27319:942-1721(+)